LDAALLTVLFSQFRPKPPAKTESKTKVKPQLVIAEIKPEPVKTEPRYFALVGNREVEIVKREVKGVKRQGYTVEKRS
jgi:hypothetical protein